MENKLSAEAMTTTDDDDDDGENNSAFYIILCFRSFVSFLLPMLSLPNCLLVIRKEIFKKESSGKILVLVIKVILIFL